MPILRSGPVACTGCRLGKMQLRKNRLVSGINPVLKGHLTLQDWAKGISFRNVKIKQL